MARIYRTTDRIPLKVGELKIVISPLSIHQKAAVEDAVDGTSTGFLNAAIKALKFSIKEIDGLEDSDGKYELSFDENNELTDDCVSDLLNLEDSPKISAIAMSLMNNIPSKFFDPLTGKDLEGVEFIVEKEEKSSRKKKIASGRSR